MQKILRLFTFFLLLISFASHSQVKILGIDVYSHEYGFKNGSIFEINLNDSSRIDKYEFEVENNIFWPYFADFISSQNKLYGQGYTPPVRYSRGFFELNLNNDSIIYFNPSDTSFLGYGYSDIYEKHPDTLLLLNGRYIYTLDLLTHTYFISDYLDSSYIGFPQGFTNHPNGKLYGSNSYGPIFNSLPSIDNGCIYSFDPITGSKNYIFFDSAIGTGEHPVSGLTLAQDGNFYGATITGSQNGRGSIFRYDPNLDTIEALFPLPSYLSNLGYVNQKLVEAVPNIFYGILYEFAPTASDSTGALFRYDVINQNFEILHVFRKNTALTFPNEIVKLGNGKIYGTSRFEDITAFTFDHFTNQISFISPINSDIYGHYPNNLIPYDSNTVLISTIEGGTDNHGALTEFKDNSTSYNLIMSFCKSDVGLLNRPYLEFDHRGKLIGNTFYGKTDDNGAIFQYDTASHMMTDTFELSQILAKYERLNSLKFNKYDQKMYGTTYTLPSYGNSFQLLSYDPQNNVAEIKKQYSLSLGNPDEELIVAEDGNLYGHRLGSGGLLGVIYKYDVNADQMLNLKVFTNSNVGPMRNPVYLKGKLVGVINDHSQSTAQTKIYTYNLANANYNEVLTIPKPSNNQNYVVAGKVISNGYNEAYGILVEWTPDSLRSAFLFKYNIDNNQLSLLHEFNESLMHLEGQFNYWENGKLHYEPELKLIVGKTSRGGQFGHGSIFKYDLNQDSFSVVLNLNESVGGMGFANSMSLLLNLDDENSLPINYFNIFPNPASESISIEIKSEINTEFYINIYNIQGIQISRLILDQNNRSIDISKLNKGIYFYEIIIDSGIQRGKFIKQ